MSINAGSLFSGLLIPVLVDKHCYSVDKSCYPQAFGLCAIVMCISLTLFMIGKKAYRIVPSSKVFIPFTAIKVLYFGFRNYLRASKNERKSSSSIVSFAKGHYSQEIIQEVFDLTSFFLVLLPAPFFWFAEQQTGTTWQTQYDQMNHNWFGLFTLNAEQSSSLNGIMIVTLVPLFSNVIYPFIEKRGRFRLIDRYAILLLKKFM